MQAIVSMRGDQRCALCGNLTECRQASPINPRWVCYACIATMSKPAARRRRRRQAKRIAALALSC